jgi:hypothetical protein
MLGLQTACESGVHNNQGQKLGRTASIQSLNSSLAHFVLKCLGRR